MDKFLVPVFVFIAGFYFVTEIEQADLSDKQPNVAFEKTSSSIWILGDFENWDEDETNDKELISGKVIASSVHSWNYPEAGKLVLNQIVVPLSFPLHYTNLPPPVRKSVLYL